MKPTGLSFPTVKYRDVDPVARAQLRAEWNQPVLWPGYALAARVEADGVHLEWNPRREERFERARVLRGGLFGHTEIGVSEPPSFVDRNVEPGNRYRYVVILERADATQAPPSQPIEVRVPTP